SPGRSMGGLPQSVTASCAHRSLVSTVQPRTDDAFPTPPELVMILTSQALTTAIPSDWCATRSLFGIRHMASTAFASIWRGSWPMTLKTQLTGSTTTRASRQPISTQSPGIWAECVGVHGQLWLEPCQQSLGEMAGSVS